MSKQTRSYFIIVILALRMLGTDKKGCGCIASRNGQSVDIIRVMHIGYP
jgi:hypothetical protein